MNKWRAVGLLVALLAGAVVGALLFLVAFHALYFFGLFTPSTEARMSYAVQDACDNFLSEKLKASRAGMPLGNEIIVKTHKRCSP